MELFTDRHAAKISGELSCLERVVISGSIPGICYAEGMSTYLRIKGIRIFDYARWAEPLRDQIRQIAQRLADYSLPALIELMRASNRRHLEFISTLDDPSCALKDVEKIALAVRENDAVSSTGVFLMLHAPFTCLP